MSHSNRLLITLLPALLLATLSAAHADESSDWEKQIEARRAEYLHWIVENFGNLEPAMDVRDGRRWALNHARLDLNRDVAKANGYFESFTPSGGDNDIYLIRFLRTLLDFRDSPRLSDEAESRIVGYIKNWPRNDRSTRAHWPPSFTENHDLMHLTIGLFAEEYRDGDVDGQIREIRKFIAHRTERGLICRGWNRSDENPILHGEIDAINRLATLPQRDPSSLLLYTTAQPCVMCQGAILWAGIGHVAYVTKATTLAELGWRQLDISAAEVTTRSFALCELTGGVLEAECDQLFRDALGATRLSPNC